MSIRQLAKEGQVSLSRASREIENLTRAGYVVKRPLVKVIRPLDLLMAFSYNWSVQSVPVKTFEAVERPEYLMGTIGEQASKNELTYGFTHLSGAELLSPYVVPSMVHLYIDMEQVSTWEELLRENGIHLSSSKTFKKVNLLMWDHSVFYGSMEIRGSKIVSPYQVFADLYGQGGMMRDAAMNLAKRMEWGLR